MAPSCAIAPGQVVDLTRALPGTSQIARGSCNRLKCGSKALAPEVGGPVYRSASRRSWSGVASSEQAHIGGINQPLGRYASTRTPTTVGGASERMWKLRRRHRVRSFPELALAPEDTRARR